MGLFKNLRGASKASKEFSKDWDPSAQLKQGMANMAAANATMGANFDAFALRNNGVKAKGTILEMNDTGMDLGGVPIKEYKLLVTPPEGSAYEVVVTRQVQPGEAGLFAPNMDLNVFVDPTDPNRVAW